MVLLKNEDNILPLEKKGKIALLGAFAKSPRYQGAGSSRINPTKLDIPLEEIEKISEDIQIIYAEGYSLDSNEIYSYDRKDNGMAQKSSGDRPHKGRLE